MQVPVFHIRNRFSRFMDQSAAVDLVKFVLAAAGAVWLLFLAGDRMDYNWQWYRVPKYLYTFQDGRFRPGPLIDGLWVTFQITAWSLVLSIFFGLSAAMLRLSNSRVGYWIARGYVETVRNTPLLVQLFFLYFVAAPVLGISRFQAAVLSLSLFEGAYASEIFRAGIVSIDRGQWEAALSLGLGRWITYRTVILPQAIRRVLPPLTSQAVSLIKDSALVSAIAVYDLTMRGRTIISETFLTFEIWFTVAAMYLIVTLALSWGVSRMERKFNSHMNR